MIPLKFTRVAHIARKGEKTMSDRTPAFGDADYPDFKNMTIRQMREDMTALNHLIKELKAIEKDNTKKFALTWGAGTLATAAVTAFFPPAAFLVLTTSTMMNVDPMARTMMARDMLRKAEDLRERYKIVWRARPGRAFHDVAARNKREVERKKQNRKFKFPGFGK